MVIVLSKADLIDGRKAATKLSVAVFCKNLVAASGCWLPMMLMASLMVICLIEFKKIGPACLAAPSAARFIL